MWWLVGAIAAMAVAAMYLDNYLAARHHKKMQRLIVEERLYEIRNGRKNQDLTVDPALLS